MSILTRLVSDFFGGRSDASNARAAASACAEAARLLRRGETLGAEAAFSRALAHEPASFAAHSGLGVLYQRRGDRARALDHLLRALELQPRAREIALLAAQILRAEGRSHDALAALEPASAAAPGDPALGHELARLRRETGDYDGARRQLEALLAHAPQHPGIIEELAIVHRECGDIDRAIEHYERLTELLPEHPRSESARLFHELYRRHERAAHLARHVRWGERFAPRSLGRSDHANDPDPERRLRVGYVSADLWWTSAAPFIEPLLAHRDRARYFVTCYHVSGRNDEVTRRLREQADDWRDADGLDDEALSAAVRNDGIDVLIDLNGHTRGGRLTAFARCPAPVQVAYLGYGASTGVAAIEYRITDRYIDPIGDADRWYTEKLVRLPGSMWCFAPPRSAPEVRAAPLTTRGFPTFGSFNNFAKVGAELIDAWAEIGAQAPSARFAIVGVPAGETRRGVAERFARRGVDPERVLFHGRVGPGEYYSLFHEVDMALDSFPYNGGTTTCDALWMGVPVLTLAGTSTLERSGLSLLSAAGLTDWVTNSKDDYVAAAVSLAGRPETLTALRAGLRDSVAASSLCDGRRFTSEVEQVLRDMWRAWCVRTREGRRS